jgi:hypothetical protein
LYTTHTIEDKVDGEEVGANGEGNHGKGEAHQLPDDGAVVKSARAWYIGGELAYVGTAGEMFDGPGGPRGSFSITAFSSRGVRLVVIVYVLCGSRLCF